VGLALCRGLYLHSTHHSEETKIMLLAGFEPTIPASEWPQIYTLGGIATSFRIFFIGILICFV
jgi:hypothetical protein